MKYSPFIAPIAVLLVIAFNQTFAESPGSELAIAVPPSQIPAAHITQLTESCHKNWQDMNWKIGEAGALAKSNPAFSDGIKKVCQARAELFFEGYELSPFIESDTQSQVYPLVFRTTTVEEVKSHIRLHLPKLKLI
jgi:hypothetical protein